MNNIATTGNAIPAMTPHAIGKVEALEREIKQFPQADIETTHCLHAGMYSRTIKIPATATLTGVLIKRSTQLIMAGHALLFVGEETFDVHGYHVFVASAGRKQAFYAHTDTWLTMMFATKAETIEEAEQEFTDEADLLMSRLPDSKNNIVITGE